MILGIVIGIAFMVCLVLAYMAGYGMADQAHKNHED